MKRLTTFKIARPGVKCQPALAVLCRCFAVFLCLIAAACSQAAPADTASTAVVVRILDLNVNLSTSIPAAATLAPTQPPPTPVMIPTHTPTPLPSPTMTASPIVEAQVSPPASATPTQPCTNRAEFVKDLTVSRNTALSGNQSFAKLWEIRNIGSCTWTTAYALVFLSGDEMGGASSTHLQQEVPPGETVDLRADLVAPVQPGTYTGNWVLEDSDGAMFGVGPQYDQTLVVTIIVTPQPPPTPG